jgi:hypothetical protein
MKHPASTVVVIVLGLSSMALGQQQTLVEASKQAEAQKAGEKSDAPKTPPKRSYTNKDLKDAPAASIIGQAPAPSSTTPATSAPVIEKTETERADDYRRTAKKDEAYWKGQMRDRQAALDADTNQVAALQVRVDALTADLERGSSIPDRINISREREKTATELARVKAVVLTDKRAITTLEEEARRANVPPGWLRP